MARLNASATIHPGSVKYLLVSVENEAGEPVKLQPDNFSVRFWATDFYVPGAEQFYEVPVVQVTNVTSGEPHTFWQLQLGDLEVVDTGEVKTTGSVPVATFEPLVYVVSIDADEDHGQAIACACCTPSVSRPELHR